jgi:hypothetical protein
MAKGHKSKTMVVSTPRKRKNAPKRNPKRNGMQKKAAMESITKRTKVGFGR